jgi:peptide/nickel transport system permease protein
MFGKFFAVLGIATPHFWVAIMLILLFGAILGWLPTYGRGGPDHFILPAFVLGWGAMAGMVRLGRSSMLDVLDSEYVKFARVKGLGERLVIWKHALKNAIIPLLTFSGLTLAGLLNGSVAIEVVFAWPGIGRLMLQGITTRDFPIVQATVLAAGMFYIVTALVVDILYAYVNPRIRYD